LDNIYQPAIIGGARAWLPEFQNFQNWGGESARLGSGIAFGKSWGAASVTLVNGGTGFSANQVINLANPSEAPYYGTPIKVLTVNGSGTIVTYELALTTNFPSTPGDPGCYALPPFQQNQQWTTENGFVDAVTGNPIFTADGSKTFYAYPASGAGGLGATFTVTWNADFGNIGNGKQYLPGNTYMQCDTKIGTVRMQSGGSTNFSPDFGPTVGLFYSGYQHNFDDVTINGFYFGGYWANASDIHGNIFNAVQSAFSHVVISSTNCIVNQDILDAALKTNLQVDWSSGLKFRGYCIAPAGDTCGDPVMVLGSNTFGASGLANSGLDFDYTVTLVSDSAPMAYLDRTRNSRVKYLIVNSSSDSASAAPFGQSTAYAAVGSNWENSNVIEGQIDNCSGPLFVNAYANCTLTSLGALTVNSSVTPTSGTIAIGQTLWNGATYLGTITAGSGTSWTVLSPTAIAATNITFLGTTFPAAGGVVVWDSAICGWCRDGGIYSIPNAQSRPTGTFGIGKCWNGSKAIYQGIEYTNIGTHVSPNWQPTLAGPTVAYNTNNATASTTLTAAEMTGGTVDVIAAMTGSLTAAATLTTDTAANIVAAASPNMPVGVQYKLRIINESSAAFAWTLAGGTGVTITGTATIAQDTWREFIVDITSATTVTLQNIGTGTFS
jgi:hypothetical protein